ncbi:hypothetical protein MMC10_008545 [Thelotrema lepadinum]|nr:hypothetical protein [Thelotrema lepadinum]
MGKPTIFLVGGAWHTVDYLKPLADIFENVGYSTVAVGLTSVGANPPATDFSGDVAAVRNAAIQLIAEDKDIIAVLHSLGGIPGSEAMHGLGKPSDSRAGVKALPGRPLLKRVLHTYIDKYAENDCDLQDGLLSLPPDFAMGMFYHDLEENQAKHWTCLLQPQSVGVYDSSLTHETYRDIPSSYILTARDQAFKHDYQLKTVEMAGFPKERTETLGTGHMPWFTKPDEVR